MYECVYMYVCAGVYMYTCIYGHTSMCMRIYMYAIYVCICVCMCLCVCICIHMCMYFKVCFLTNKEKQDSSKARDVV